MIVRMKNDRVEFHMVPLKRTKEYEVEICWQEKDELERRQHEKDREEARKFWAEKKRKDEEARLARKVKRAQEAWRRAFFLKRRMLWAKAAYTKTPIGKGGFHLWQLIVAKDVYYRALGVLMNTEDRRDREIVKVA